MQRWPSTIPANGAFVLLGMLVLLLPLEGRAQADLSQRESLQNQIEALEREAVELDRQIASTQEEARTLERQIKLFNDEIRRRELEIRRLNLAVRQADVDIRIKAASIE